MKVVRTGVEFSDESMESKFDKWMCILKAKRLIHRRLRLAADTAVYSDSMEKEATGT